jgi:DprA winged helix domain
MRNIHPKCQKHDKTPVINEKDLRRVWTEFETRFPTCEDWISELLGKTGGEGFLRCRYCRGRDVQAEARGRVIKCRSRIYAVLSTEPVHSDTLLMRTGIMARELIAAMTMLQLQGLVTHVGGNLYVRGGQPIKISRITSTSFEAKEEKEMIDSIIDFIKRKFHGVSRKHLQLYLAEYWCYIDRTRWALGSLLQACREFCTVRHDEVCNYESPLVVSILPAQWNLKNSSTAKAEVVLELFCRFHHAKTARTSIAKLRST